MLERDYGLDYPRVEVAANAVAEWLKRCRDTLGLDDQLTRCGPEEAGELARRLHVSVGELQEMIRRGPHGADLVRKMLAALEIDAAWLLRKHPGVMQDLQRLCVSCREKGRCAHELDVGAAAKHYRDFCPNAFTLGALVEEVNAAKVH